ncbi:MAG: hypothetical protein OER85_08565 [Gammaproteobacteria bacterium]|nr:hypothetical protein [Gammaproteobacteria bacterium]
MNLRLLRHALVLVLCIDSPLPKRIHPVRLTSVITLFSNNTQSIFPVSKID